MQGVRFPGTGPGKRTHTDLVDLLDEHLLEEMDTQVMGYYRTASRLPLALGTLGFLQHGL